MTAYKSLSQYYLLTLCYQPSLKPFRRLVLQCFTANSAVKLNRYKLTQAKIVCNYIFIRRYTPYKYTEINLFWFKICGYRYHAYLYHSKFWLLGLSLRTKETSWAKYERLWPTGHWAPKARGSEALASGKGLSPILVVPKYMNFVVPRFDGKNIAA